MPRGPVPHGTGPRARCGIQRTPEVVGRAMKIDIWSDVVCPFCYVGKRRLEQALEQFPHRDQVEVVWHSFELDPSAPAVPTGSVVDKLSAKYGISREQAVASNENLAEMA